jgi:hypothetical protein
MFNFEHTEEELRDIIQALEAKVFGHQQHIKKLVAQAQAQANAAPIVDASAPAPVAEAPAPVAPADQPAADSASVQPSN